MHLHSNIRAQRKLGREIRAANARAARERLTDAQIDTILARAIIDAVTARGTVVEADMARCNVPAAALTQGRYARCLALAREMCPSLDRAWSEA